MWGMNSESVDLIYLDLPFNSKANYAAPIGSAAAEAEFKDTWTLQDVDIAWLDLIEAKHPRLNKVIHAAMSKSDKSYLIYMAVRLLEMHRLLKPSSLLVVTTAVGRPGRVSQTLVYGIPTTGRHARRH